MPEGAIYVGRPTKWGNPYPLTFSEDARRLAVERYRFWLSGGLRHGKLPPQPHELAELRGKDLACWCPLSVSCHADVLLELANAGGLIDA
jgi:hypothetical protein